MNKFRSIKRNKVKRLKSSDNVLSSIYNIIKGKKDKALRKKRYSY